ncbi:hypothetical protein NLG97_g6346 [Lecanicillium saksenae]|uniref:Uncharacterized protein n=1 Tax=Lecanicillium saksenae TaxID=468837 RepID=A0ACC1QT31_9HYPO|nr:hypothetical protein NLG97_g6346 [Lecanicillium saksenae]
MSTAQRTFHPKLHAEFSQFGLDQHIGCINDVAELTGATKRGVLVLSLAKELVKKIGVSKFSGISCKLDESNLDSTFGVIFEALLLVLLTVDPSHVVSAQKLQDFQVVAYAGKFQHRFRFSVF